MHVTQWRILPAGDFASATVAVSMAPSGRSVRRIEAIESLPPIGSGVQIRLAESGGRTVFDGYITRHLAGVGSDEEYLAIEAEDALTARLARLITGRWQDSDASAVFVPLGDCVFNTDPEGLASAGMYNVNSRSCRIFRPDGEGQLWSIGDILRYLLAAHVPGDVDIVGLDVSGCPAGVIYPHRLSLTGLPALDAIVQVAAIAGMSIRSGACIGTGRRSLVFYPPGHAGRRRSVRLQPAGQTLDACRSNLWKGDIKFNRRPSRRTVLVIGGLKRYESTFELHKGWDTDKESYRYRDFIRSESFDWPEKADVFRKWVLNESGFYRDEPYELEEYDFSDIASEDFILLQARRFEPCLSLSDAGRSMGIVVEISYDDGSTWRRYGGAVRFAADEVRDISFRRRPSSRLFPGGRHKQRR